MTKHWFSDVREFRRDPLSLLRRKGHGAKGPFVSLALGFKPVLLVTSTPALRAVMRASDEVIDKGAVVSKLKPILGNSSLTLNGEAHRKRREVLHSRLARGTAEGYAGDMAAVIRQASLPLLAMPSFRADIFGSSLALRLICTALFGKRALSPGDETVIVEAVHALEHLLQAEMFRFLPLSPWSALRQRRQMRSAKSLLDAVVKKVEGRVGDCSVLTALRDIGLTDRQIGDELLTMLIAGYHTTGSAAAWLLHYLAMYPRLTEEIMSEAANVTDGTGEVDPRLLKDAHFSLNLVKEVLRLHPPAWWTTREAIRAVEIEGLPIAAGTTFLISPWLFHHDNRHFPNADEFNPKRHFNSQAFLPFGIGHRTCVGMGVALLELQLIALEFCAAFKMTLPVSSAKPEIPSPGVILGAPELQVCVELRGNPGGGLQVAA